MSPRKPADPAPPKAWRREVAGTYRSADDRFELAGDGAGRWFVRDEAATDELGLPRTTGPFATLADAKAAADAQREAGAPASPLAGRIDAARSQPAKTADRESGTEARTRVKGASKEPVDRPVSAATSKPTPGAATPSVLPARPRPTWLDELEARDPGAARQARTQVRTLEERGIDDADALVRRDRLGGRPAVAERLLLVAIRARVAEALADAPGSPAERAAIATRVIAAVLEAISSGETGRSLPTWELVEATTGRRLRPDPSDNRRSTDPMPERAPARRRPTP